MVAWDLKANQRPWSQRYECVKAQKQRGQPLNHTALPSPPWQKVVSDLFELKGVTYLLIVGYYSSYIEIVGLEGTTYVKYIYLTWNP